jgi:hypothetical protein
MSHKNLLTQNQAQRSDFAKRAVHLLREMDSLLIEEAKELKAIPDTQLQEILFRKVHVGGIPYCVKRNAYGILEPNFNWVSRGYFNMNS